MVAFNRDGPAYTFARRLADDDASIDAPVAIFGVPYDGTTSNRPGARFGPDALRSASAEVETYSPEQDEDLEDLDYVDLGNLWLSLGAPEPVVEATREATAKILDAGAKPLVFGGEHSISAGVFAAQAARHPDLIIIQLDAHADLRREYLGTPNSHACAMARALDHVASDSLLQIGIRSGTREEWQELRVEKRRVAPTFEAVQAALAARPERPVHLTVDLDVFDPSAFPGTGTPEAGGIFWPEFAAILRALPAERLVGADVVELAPMLDPTGISSALAAKVVREILLKLG